MSQGLLLHKKGDRDQLSNYRLLSIAPTMSRFLGAIFSQQLRPILEHHYGPEQHGFRKGHSTVSLLHILEAVIHTSMTTSKEVAIVQIDVAKAFDKVHRGALTSFAKNIIHGVAPEAATFIESMYDGDEVTINFGKATKTVTMKSGIRQGDPLSPALFSALVGHILRPLIIKWKAKGWGAELDPNQPWERVTLLAYADDITVFAASRNQASAMINEMTAALEGINLRLLPEKCSALWSKTPDGSESAKINLGSEEIPIHGALVVLGQEISFKKDSMHAFQHRLRQAWKTAHANTILLRSTAMSHGARIRLLQALVKPSLLYGSETWKLTPALLAKIIGAERAFSRWCMRLTNRAGRTDDEEGDLAAWFCGRPTRPGKLPTQLAMGWKGGQEHRNSKSQGGNRSHQTRWQRKTAGALGPTT
jgi:hypothetical protein